MKKTNKLFTVALAAVVGFATFAFTIIDATSWEIDKAHSAVNFKVTHFFTPVNGQFNDYNATVNFDPQNLEESSLDVEIMVNSIDTDNERRDNHLMSDDFFSAETYPMITFKSESIEATGNNTFVANGTLTIKDVSRDIELPFELLGVRDNPMQEGKVVAGIVSTFKLNRTTYDVGVGDWASDAVIGDEVTVDLNLELNADKAGSNTSD